MQFSVFALIFVTLFSFSYEIDEIKKLPGVKFNVTFKHYSGYLQVSDTHFLHYWFVESQNDPTNDPLIFWYNGGPGCSSLEGNLHEMGPYLIDSNGRTLHENPNSWNKFASVVYIEAPAGVGYSYSSDGNTTTNDDQTAEENYKGIKEFFKRHPDFRNHSTFIIGESYGGVYIPMLTSQIIDGQNDFPINLGGMAIGNGKLYDNDVATTAFLYYHGLVDDTQWNEVENNCCNGCIDTCDYLNETDECRQQIRSLQSLGWSSVNVYDIYGKCDNNPRINSKRYVAYQRKIAPNDILESSSNDKTVKNSIPCLNDTDIETYMNLPYVRRALHVPQNLSEWNICGGVDYHEQYDDMTAYIKKVLDSAVPVLLYFGDTDLICNFMMGQKFVAQLGLPVEKQKTSWKVDGQTAGFQTIYKGLTFVTIRGAGHMAPGLKAPETAHAIKQFVAHQPI